MNRTAAPLAVFLAALVSLVGCQSPLTPAASTPPTSNDDPIVGTWDLKSYVVGSQGVTADSTTQTGSFSAASGSFSWELKSGSNTSTSAGTWTKSGSLYTLTTSPPKAVWTGTITGGKLTIVNSAAVGDAAYKAYTYSK